MYCSWPNTQQHAHKARTLSHCWYGDPLFIGVSILCSLSARVGPRACSGWLGGGSQSNATGGATIPPSDDPAHGRGMRWHFLTQ